MLDTISPAPSLDLSASIEALLFVASGSVTSAQLATVLEVTTQQVDAALKQLDSIYSNPDQPRGLRLQRLHGRIILTSAPETAPQVERFLGLETSSRLSRAALETLAIIAYREPVTRPQIDAIRGVNSDGVLKSLLSKGLIQEIGRAEMPGRPILYNVTSDFLSHFGLSSLDELPPLTEVTPASEAQNLEQGSG